MLEGKIKEAVQGIMGKFTDAIDKLKTKSSMKDIAFECGISSNIVERAFKLLPNTKNFSLPEVLGIDEFKGNTDGEKYNLILTNLQDNKIYDILPTRKKTDIISYFKRYSLKSREKVIPELKDVITAFRNWFTYIVNSFRYKYTNGFTEGMNNNIKVLKRIAYGYRNFNNFRKRIMHCFG